MKKITLLFEDDFAGKKDTIKKEIDLDYQAGSIEVDEDAGFVRVIDSFCIDLIDFVRRIDIDLDQFIYQLAALYDETLDDDLLESVEDFEEPKEDELDTANQLSYDDFLIELNNNEDFKKRMYQVYQLYFNK